IAARLGPRFDSSHSRGTPMSTKTTKGCKGLGMEGFIARWYARNTEGASRHREVAERIAGSLTDGAHVLEVAPGPGYLAIELAKFRRFQVAGLDISQTFVQIASDNAAKAGVAVTFHHGDAAA